MICPLCGMNNSSSSDSPDGFCPHHVSGNDKEWAVANRVICNFIHRKIPLARVPLEDREPLDETANSSLPPSYPPGDVE